MVINLFGQACLKSTVTVTQCALTEYAAPEMQRAKRMFFEQVHVHSTHDQYILRDSFRDTPHQKYSRKCNVMHPKVVCEFVTA